MNCQQCNGTQRIWTGGMWGDYEDCDCKSHPRGVFNERGEVLALVGCQCRLCFAEIRRGPRSMLAIETRRDGIS